MEKSLMTEYLEVNRETKMEEGEVEGCVCLCLRVKEEGQSVKRERNICEVVWLRISGLVGCHVCGTKNICPFFLFFGGVTIQCESQDLNCDWCGRSVIFVPFWRYIHIVLSLP